MDIRKDLLERVDGLNTVLLGFGAYFWRLSADRTDFIVNDLLVLLPHVCSSSLVKIHGVVKILRVNLEFHARFVLQVDMRLGEYNKISSLGIIVLVLTLFLSQWVMGHGPAFTATRGLLAACKRDILLREKFVNQLSTVVRSVLLAT